MLAIYAYKTGEHSSIKSKSYVKDVWSQRKIYAPILVHLYDTSTDIGVVYYWYILMLDEQQYGGSYYTSVDMTVFFWVGAAFLIIYRLLILIYIIADMVCGLSSPFQNVVWYDPILVIFDVYILKTVYQSFKEAQDVITKNIQKRKKKNERKRQQKKEKQIEMEISSGSSPTATDGKSHVVVTEEKEDDIDPSEGQVWVQIFEAVLESMPQIMLQSVFIVRAANDEKLSNGTNLILIFFSIIASLFSISNKFVVIDKDEINDLGKSLKPSQECPHCVDYWYVVRVIWRICNIMSNFVVYVLIWTVMGGVWLCVWSGVTYIYWITMRSIFEGCDIEHTMHGLMYLVGIAIDEMKYNFLKYIHNIVGFVLIFIFATIKFDCSICADSETRQFMNDKNNHRILIFFVMGSVSFN